MVDPRTLAIAVELIERFEGIETEAYLDPVGIPTICAGITAYPNGDPVRMGDVCDERICKAHLNSLLSKKYLPKLEAIPGWARLGANQQAVLISFAWNLGAGFYGQVPDFETITNVLKEGAVNPEAYNRMPAALALYVNAGGGPLPGLVTRRRIEGEYWMKDTNAVLRFKAQRETVLKVAPIDSKYLSDLGKKPIAAGEVLEVAQVIEIPESDHNWFVLAGTGEKWAAYMPHWVPSRADTTAPASTPTAPAPAEVNWDDFSCRVGRYITVGEVLQYDARRKPRVGSAEETAILLICREFDKIREAWKGPLGVTSGYRPEPINAQVGGVPNSYHTKGMALDVYPIGASLEQFYQWISKRWSGGLGDGRNKGFVHLDMRDGGKFSSTPDVKPAAVWLY